MDQLQGGGLVLQSLQGRQPLLSQLSYVGVVNGFEVLFGGVLDKDIEEAAVLLGVDKVAVVLDPPDCAVLSDDAVFHVVQLAAVGVYLLLDALLRILLVLRVHQSGEGVAGVSLELLQGLAAVYMDQGLIGVDQTLVPSGMIDKEAAGHPRCDLFNDGKRLFTEQQRMGVCPLAPLHCTHLPLPLYRHTGKFYHVPEVCQVKDAFRSGHFAGRGEKIDREY